MPDPVTESSRIGLEDHSDGNGPWLKVTQGAGGTLNKRYAAVESDEERRQRKERGPLAEAANRHRPAAAGAALKSSETERLSLWLFASPIRVASV